MNPTLNRPPSSMVDNTDGQAGTPTLFDPFWNVGKAWKKASVAPKTPQCEVVAIDALEGLKGLAEQFQAPTEGWKALLLAPPGMRSQAWATPAKSGLIAALIPTVIPLERTAWVFLLPDNRVAVVLYHPATEGIVKVVYGLAGLLVGEDNAPKTTVVMADLGKNPLRLKEWAYDCEGRLKAKNFADESAQQQQQVNEVRHVLGSTPVQTARRSTRAQPLVLVVEDDPSTALLLETLLSSFVTVVVAHNAHEAAQLYPRHVPDLVFMDIGLPDVNGLGLLEQLKKADAAAHVVMLTANATHANLAAATQAGAKGFLAKPFTRDKLQQALSVFIKK